MDPLGFKLDINVPETSIIHSLIGLVKHELKKLTDLLVYAKSIEIKLYQKGYAGEECVVAEISLAYPGGTIHEVSESKMWDVAFLNAVDQVKAGIPNSEAIPAG